MVIELKPRRGGGGHSGGGHFGGGGTRGGRSSGGNSGSGSKPKSPKNPKGIRPVGNGRGHHTTTTTTTDSSATSSSSSTTKTKKHKKTKSKKSKKKTKAKKNKRFQTDPSRVATTEYNVYNDQVTSYSPLPTTLISRTFEQKVVSMDTPTMTSILEDLIPHETGFGPELISSCEIAFSGIPPNMLCYVAGGAVALIVVFIGVCRLFTKSDDVNGDSLEKDSYYIHLPGPDDSVVAKGGECSDQTEIEKEALLEKK
ncbi:hypothetical protein KGF57_001026 [Candida theae]|uniref:Uncharacterized protein n=1 Tax=Candida theae TaxID=1198502 RepID=A0AAD5BIG8_9ASCO|nr:uncharacterized protein KGF57_001026 [Candida theae]KAI5964534.1 hypothetical protein KGF57_001026 [Candida theae]